VRLPRQIEADAQVAAIRAALAVRVEPLWPGGVLHVPVLTPTPALVAALCAARAAGQLCRGLEAAETALAAERKGLALAARRAGAAHGARVSRLLVCARDGAERFYRQVEHLLREHAPRVLCVVVDLDSVALGEALFGPGATAKLVMAEHKDAVAGILYALAGVTPAARTPGSRSGAS
jgi:hypothetical protein